MGVQKRPNGKFRLQLRRGGFKVDETYDTQEEADEAERKHLEIMNPPKMGKTTLNQAWAKYELSGDFKDAPENTKLTYRRRIQPSLDALGAYSLRALEDSPEVVKSYFDRRRSAKKTRGSGRYSNMTIRLEIAALSALISFAIERKLCRYNPVFDITRPPIVNRTRRVAEQERAQLQLARREHRDILHHILFQIALESLGCRPGELASAKQVHFSASRRELSFYNTKGNLDRKVHVPPTALSAINEQLKTRAAKDEYIFSSKSRDKRPIPYNWGPGVVTLRKRGIVLPGFHSHANRREFISNGIEENINTHALRLHVGHKSVVTTEGYNMATSTSKTLRDAIDGAEKSRDKDLIYAMFRSVGMTEEQLERFKLMEQGDTGPVVFKDGNGQFHTPFKPKK